MLKVTKLYDQDETIRVDLSRRELALLSDLLVDAGLAVAKERDLHIKLRIAETEILNSQMTARRQAQKRHPSSFKEV